MKIIISFLILIFFFFNNVYASNISNNIVFIDVDYIFENSKVGKDLSNQIKFEAEKLEKELIKFEKKFNESEKDLINQKNIITEEDFIKRKEILEQNVNNFRKLYLKKNENFLKFEAEANNLFLENLDKILKIYVKENSIDLIISKKNIIIGKKNFDATISFLNMFDKLTKPRKIKNEIN